jgi:hypothetical protein
MIKNCSSVWRKLYAPENSLRTVGKNTVDDTCFGVEVKEYIRES